MKATKNLKNTPKVLIVIPCLKIDDLTRICLMHCLKLDYPNYEIAVLPDYVDEGDDTYTLDRRVHIIATGHISPLRKRLLACKAIECDIVAFIDSDAYPASDWISNAIKHFSDKEIAAVTGPNLTPEGSTLQERASGLILSSWLGGGTEALRYSRRSQACYVKEAPMCNLIVRRSIIEKLNDLPDVYPGEEIVFCGKIVQDLRKKILYDPSVIVYHHRKPLFVRHLKQIWNYGFIKGIMFKRFPKYVRTIFLLPSCMLMGLILGGILSLFNQLVMLIVSLTFLTYIILCFITGIRHGIREHSAKITFLVFLGIVLTHLCYGLAFIRGVLTRKRI